MSVINLVTVVLGVIYVTQNTVFGHSRIVGGTFCPLSEHPYVVQISSFGTCGGTLISVDWVLTAAHCVNLDYTKYGRTKVRSGFNLTDQNAIQERTAKYAVVHEKFNSYAQNFREPPELRYDIALVLVNTSFHKTETLDVAILPKQGETSTCVFGLVCGAGEEAIKFETKKKNLNNIYQKSQMVKRGIVDHPLKCVNLNIVNASICARTYPGSIVDDDMIVCTREIDWGKDACQGDSGGPLLCQDSKVIIGIISFGFGCGLPGKAAVHTRVAYYIDFIKKVMAKNFTNSKWTETVVPPEETKTSDTKKNKANCAKNPAIQNFIIGSSTILLLLTS